MYDQHAEPVAQKQKQKNHKVECKIAHSGILGVGYNGPAGDGDAAVSVGIHALVDHKQLRHTGECQCDQGEEHALNFSGEHEKADHQRDHRREKERHDKRARL